MIRRVFAVLGAVFVSLACIIPANAYHFSVPITNCGPHGSTYEELYLSESAAPPRRSGETDDQLLNVYTWVGLEYTTDDCAWGEGRMSDGVFEAMRAGLGFYDSYYITNAAVYTYTPQASNGVVWKELNRQTRINDSVSYYYDRDASSSGLDGAFYFLYDDGSYGKIGSMQGVSYAAFFDSLFYTDSTPTTDIDSLAMLGLYTLHSSVEAFAVRWTAIDESGYAWEFCYIGICQDATDLNITDYSPRLINLGKNHPWCSYTSGRSGGNINATEQLQEQIDSLNQIIAALEEQNEQDRLNHIASVNALTAQKDKEIEAAKSTSYQAGYDAAREDFDSNIMIDTSDPAKTLMGFFTVLFMGVRDFLAPFYDISFFGISVRYLVGGVALVAVAFLVVGIIFKVIRG